MTSNTVGMWPIRIIILDDKHLVKDMMLAEFHDYEAFTKAPRSGVTARTSTSAFPRADGKHGSWRRHRVPFIEQGEHSECGLAASDDPRRIRASRDHGRVALPVRRSTAD